MFCEVLDEYYSGVNVYRNRLKQKWFSCRIDLYNLILHAYGKVLEDFILTTDVAYECASRANQANAASIIGTLPSGRS